MTQNALLGFKKKKLEFFLTCYLKRTEKTQKNPAWYCNINYQWRA